MNKYKIILLLLLFLLSVILFLIVGKKENSNTINSSNVKSTRVVIPTQTPVFKVLPTSPVKLKDVAALEFKLNEYAKKNSLMLHLSYEHSDGTKLSINGDEKFNALSTIKILIMIETFKQLNENKILSTDLVSRYGYKNDVEKALKSMMISSNNEATGALLLKLGGAGVVNKTIKNYIGDDMKTQLSRTPGYQSEGGSNYSTMNEQTKLMKLIKKGEVINPVQSNVMLGLLAQCNDYFSLRTIKGMGKIYMKTGYYPPTQYGVTAIVENQGGNYYVLSVQAYSKSKKSIKKESVKDLFQIVNDFSD